MLINEKIRQAIARGYCLPENSSKELDSVLVEAMALEVDKVVKELISDMRNPEPFGWS